MLFKPEIVIYFKVKLQHLKILTSLLLVMREDLICAVFVITRVLVREMPEIILSQFTFQIHSPMSANCARLL